jgi:hypothetical protein
VLEGGLMSYGPDLRETNRIAGRYCGFISVRWRLAAHRRRLDQGVHQVDPATYQAALEGMLRDAADHPDKWARGSEFGAPVEDAFEGFIFISPGPWREMHRREMRERHEGYCFFQ